MQLVTFAIILTQTCSSTDKGVRLSDGSYRLIDLDATVRMKESAGEKMSTAYSPPEMTFVEAEVVRFKIPGCSVERCPATPALDFWGLGCVLFRALTHKPLFEADDADNIYSPRELKRLHLWGPEQVGETLRGIDAALRDAVDVSNKQRILVCDLVGWMLQRDPSKRPESAQDLLSHALFFTDSFADDQRISNGKTIMSQLHLAAALAPVEQVETIIAAGGGTTLSSPDHILAQTPLHVAATAMRADVVRVMLSKTSSSSRATEQSATEQSAGQNSRATESEISRSTVVEGLADPDATDACGDTAVHALLKSVVFMSNAEHTEAILCVLRVLAPITNASLLDSQGRTIFDVGCASAVEPIRTFFVERRQEEVDKKRRKLFLETMLAPVDGMALKPWSLTAEQVQDWARKNLPKNAKSSLTELIDALNVDGLTLLEKCIELTSSKGNKGLGNFNTKVLQTSYLTGMAKPVRLLHALLPDAVIISHVLPELVLGRSQAPSKRCWLSWTRKLRATTRLSYYRARDARC